MKNRTAPYRLAGHLLQAHCLRGELQVANPIDNFDLDGRQVTYTGESFKKADIRKSLPKLEKRDEIQGDLNKLVDRLVDSVKGAKKLGPEERDKTRESMIANCHDNGGTRMLIPICEDIHDQLARIGVRDLKLVAPIVEKTPGLPRMPLLVHDPAGALRCEAKHRRVCRCPGENTVGGGEMFVELRFGNVQRVAYRWSRLQDPLQRKTAQALAPMAPRVEVPVVAVVNQALRRDFTIGNPSRPPR